MSRQQTSGATGSENVTATPFSQQMDWHFHVAVLAPHFPPREQKRDLRASGRRPRLFHADLVADHRRGVSRRR